MAYLDLMILLSRYIFLGFGIVFIIVAFSFMKPFISYTLGSNRNKNNLLYLCIVFFHIGAMSILLGKQGDKVIRSEMIVNTLIVLGVITASRWLIQLTRRQEQLVLWHLIFFLIDIGYLMLERLDHATATRQTGWLVLGMGIAFTAPYLFKHLMKSRYKWLYLILTYVLIFLPFVFGETIYGATNWVQIGPIGFQPSEFGKVTFIMYLASALWNFDTQEDKLKALITLCATTAGIVLGLVIQRDLGAALLYFATFLVLLYLGTKKWWLSLLGFIAGGMASLVAYQLFAHVRVRVQAWINPWVDIENTGYQVVQGLFAMGTWGFLGSGLTRGIPEQIPIATSDYIFPAICEEFGNGIGIVILLCYLGIVLQGLKVALVQEDGFSKFLTIGIVIMFALQALIILCGVMKLIPLTGITLPFVSYGGSSMLTSLSMAGILGYLLATTLKKVRKEQKHER